MTGRQEGVVVSLATPEEEVADTGDAAGMGTTTTTSITTASPPIPLAELEVAIPAIDDDERRMSLLGSDSGGTPLVADEDLVTANDLLMRSVNAIPSLCCVVFLSSVCVKSHSTH